MFYYVLFLNTKPYGARHVHKPLLGSCVTSCRLACSEISLQLTKEKKWEMSGHSSSWYMEGKL